MMRIQLKLMPRRALAILLAGAALALLATGGRAEEAKMERDPTIYSVKVEPMADSKTTTDSLAQYKGKVLLVVNVASKCGLTPQYEALEQLYQKYKDSGLEIVGFPCNDYGSQEPGTEQEIITFCQTNYNVTFPLYAKLHTIGDERSALYTWLSGDASPFPGPVAWNFGKFLINRKGELVARFEPKTTPLDPEVTKAIETELKKQP